MNPGRLAWGALVLVLASCSREKKRDTSGASDAGLSQDAVSVEIIWPGASNASLETEAVVPIEGALARIGGASGASARIENGRALIVERFDGLGMEDWAEEVRAATAAVEHQLPRGVRLTISRGVEAPAALWLAISGPGSVVDESELARSVVRARIERLKGVRGAPISGERTKALFVIVDPAAACRAGVFIDDVTSIVGAQKGRDPKEMLALPVRRAAGSELHLSDIAAVEEGTREPPSDAPVAVGVSVMTGVSPAGVLADVRAELDAIRKDAPPGYELREMDSPPATERPSHALVVLGADEKERTRIAHDLAAQWKLRPDVFRRVVEEAPSEEKQVMIDRTRASALGVDVARIVSALQALVGGSELGSSFERRDTMPLVVRLGPTTAELSATLPAICVPDNHGGAVSLALVTNVKSGLAEAPIHRRNGKRVAVVGLDLAPGRSLGDARDLARAAASALDLGYGVEIE